MALICPKCGNTVSDEASSCIHCGIPISADINHNPQSEVENNSTSYASSKISSTPKLISIVITVLALVLIIVAVIEIGNGNIFSSVNSGKYPWTQVPLHQNFSNLTEPYIAADTSEEVSANLIDLVLNSKVIIDNSSEYRSYIDSRITYKDCFNALEKNNCRLSFFTRESHKGNYVLVAIKPPKNLSTYEQNLLTLVEFSISPANNSVSLNSYVNVYTSTLGPHSSGSSIDQTTFGDNDLFYTYKPIGTPYDYSFLVDEVNALFSINAEEYSLFVNKKGFPSAFSYNGFMNFTSKKSATIKIKDVESDIFMIYHDERYADDLFTEYYTEMYGDDPRYTYEYIGTTYNSFYVAEENAYTCDIYKLTPPEGKEEFYVIPFNLSGPLGVYYFSGNEIPSLREYYTTNNGEDEFLELVWTLSKA